ncbi:MAG TPA: FadR/GntR family transcriptional regulator [Hyphomicrobiales bacterium]|nr:FadR/GntR family transcriptional regulator [Kaistiaceae bacterium]HQF30534.1 FadR/GntR family transcriptional regulator [Hyphomicrobiales bacterium]
MFRKIEQNRTADAVVRQIEELVLSGVLRSGERLPGERELARELDVSRPILRDALAALEAAGLVVSRRGEGTFVADVTGSVFSEAVVGLFHHHPKATADYLEFRREIESLAAGLAALRATEADRVMLTLVFERMLAAHERDDFTEEAAVDVEFHDLVGECTHNIVLMHTLRSCYRLLAEGVFYNRSRIWDHPGARDRLIEQHRRLYEAIMARDPAEARIAAAEHIAYVADTTREIEQRGAWQEISALRLARSGSPEATPARRGSGRRKGTDGRRSAGRQGDRA